MNAILDDTTENHVWEYIASKIKDAETAIQLVKSGDKVFIGSACATPRVLITALEKIGNTLADVQLCHFLTDGAVIDKDGVSDSCFEHQVFFVGTDCRELIKKGKAQYVPISIAQLSKLIEIRSVPVDVAFVQVSYPDNHGYVSLGVSVDITLAAVLNAKTVIAELNPNMPYTQGDSQIHVDQIDCFVKVNSPVIEYVHEPADEVTQQIARYVARIIDDNATLQIGLGQIPNEMLKYLTNRRNLGIHSDVITEPVIELIEKKIVTCNKKAIHPGKIVTSYCMGTEKLYRYVDRNPFISFHPIQYVCDPGIIMQNHKMVAISQAFAIDLMGQVCADQFKGELYSGVSTQPDFNRYAAAAPGGKAIICLRSTTDDGSESRIRPQLLEGEGVTIPRSDVHYVVTEYGMAYLFGKSIQKRALSLIEIAHPDFRDDLLETAKTLGYLRQDQHLRSKVAYPENEEKSVTLKNGVNVNIRPSKASDLEGIKEIFYQLTPEDIYTRFFSKLSSLPVSIAEHLCDVDYDNEMAFVAVTGERENETIVGSSIYFVIQSENIAEVAYMIVPAWQKVGLGSALQDHMIGYAKKKGLNGFVADTLSTNKKMLSVLQKAGKVSIKRDAGTYVVYLIFE